MMVSLHVKPSHVITSRIPRLLITGITRALLLIICRWSSEQRPCATHLTRKPLDAAQLRTQHNNVTCVQALHECQIRHAYQGERPVHLSANPARSGDDHHQLHQLTNVG